MKEEPAATIKDDNSIWGSLKLSDVATRNFCKTCGSLICMDYHAPNTVWVPLGILDNECAASVATQVDPARDSQIFSESKVPWMDSLEASLPLRISFGTYKADVCGSTSYEDLPSWKEEEESNQLPSC